MTVVRGAFPDRSAVVTSLMPLLVFVLVVLLAPLLAQAEKPVPSVALVNGEPITEAQFQRALERARSQGGVDSAALRAAVKSELIARALFAQAARQRKLHDDPVVLAAVEEARTNALVARYLTEAIRPRPITDEEARAQYDRIWATLGPEEYQLRLILVGDSARADEVLAAVKGGQPFAALAQHYSVAPSASQGGLLDWVSFKSPAAEGATGGLPLALAQAVETLRPGAVSGAIAFGDRWMIVKLEAKRPTMVPSFKQAKAALVDMLAVRELERATAELVDTLVKNATIVP
jgi:peptidyl-prolyl cis-trans isomerase C